MDREAGQVLTRLRSSFRPADAAEDVVDPHGLGDAAAAMAAEHLDSLVGKLVTALGAQPGLGVGAVRHQA